MGALDDLAVQVVLVAVLDAGADDVTDFDLPGEVPGVEVHLSVDARRVALGAPDQAAEIPLFTRRLDAVRCAFR